MVKVNKDKNEVILELNKYNIVLNVDKNNNVIFRLESNKYKTIISIEENEMEINRILNILLEDIKESNILENNKEFNIKQSKRKRYKELYNNDSINIKSDTNENIVKIEKINHRFKLTFINNEDETSKIIEVIIKGTGSKYNPYNLIFQRMVNNFLTADLKDYQLSLDYYL